MRAAVARANETDSVIAGREMDIPQRTIRQWMQRDRDGTLIGDDHEPDFEVPALPSYQASTEEILERRRKEFARRSMAKAARGLIHVPCKIDGPILIWHQGDPHLDDPGTNIELIEEHCRVIRRTEGAIGACVGDFVNNWRRFLAHLHADQSTTQQEAHKLLEWYLEEQEFLYLIGGNHDVWSGNEDPLIWLTRGIGSIYEWHGARLSIDLPKGNFKSCRIHVRHDWPGTSMYNRAHGATKALKFKGEDHVYLNGHKHTWGHYEEENTILDIVSHAIQVGSYKEVDDYADSKALEAGRYGQACGTLINPYARTPQSFVHVFWDIYEATDFLTFLRSKK